VSMTRPWHLATTNTGLGDPRAATAEKGRRLVDAITQRLAGFLVDLAKLPFDEKFPY
jgi:creatinine amidohydrolase